MIPKGAKKSEVQNNAMDVKRADPQRVKRADPLRVRRADLLLVKEHTQPNSRDEHVQKKRKSIPNCRMSTWRRSERA